MKPMTLESLRDARAAILRNATELRDDSRPLLIDGRYARPFALTVLAREEMGKLATVVRAFYAVEGGQVFDGPRLGKRLRSRHHKLQVFALIEMLISNNVTGDKDPKATLLQLLADPSKRQRLDEGKQDGLYASVLGSSVDCSSDVITGRGSQGTLR